MLPSELLSQEGAWRQEAYAKLKDGSCAKPTDPRTTRWCAEGAMQHCGIDFNKRRAFSDAVGGTIFWNDAPSRTQAEVVAKLKELGL